MKKKGRNAVPMNSKVLISVESEEVELLVSPQKSSTRSTQVFVFWRRVSNSQDYVKRPPSSIRLQLRDITKYVLMEMMDGEE